MNKQEAYTIVFKDLIQCGMFKGIYDARKKGRSDHFMYGISTVMENIAYNVSDEVGDNFSDLFTRNMVISENKAEIMKLKEKIETLKNEIDTLEDENDKARAEV